MGCIVTIPISVLLTCIWMSVAIIKYNRSRISTLKNKVIFVILVHPLVTDLMCSAMELHALCKSLANVTESTLSWMEKCSNPSYVTHLLYISISWLTSLNPVSLPSRSLLSREWMFVRFSNIANWGVQHTLIKWFLLPLGSTNFCSIPLKGFFLFSRKN